VNRARGHAVSADAEFGAIHGPTIFDAVREPGLKLVSEPAVECLVIDSVERPTED